MSKKEKIDHYMTCNICNTVYILNVYPEDLADALNNIDKSIQDIFPYLSADKRELFLTGWCGSCFDSLMK